MTHPAAVLDELAIFNEALEQPSPAARADYLDRVCEADKAVRARVETLLAAHGRAGGFLESPAEAVTVDAAPSALLECPGTVIGPYKLMEQIGEGGMGVVYVAEQIEPVRRRVALKIIKPGMDTKQVVARFEAERQALALMDHTNIARVFDGGSTSPLPLGEDQGEGRPAPGGRPYFVMELVRGVAITEYCDREQLSIRDRLDLFVLVCRAVQHAHQKGIIHRDLKPSNILVTVIDGVAVPKIIDFGVAKATGASLTERTLYTGFHQFIGTPLYMSPEQADISGMDVDTRSDVYSLGVLLYELLTSTTPFDQETFRTAAFDEMRRIIREQEPPKPSTRLNSLGELRTTVSANRKADARHLDRTVRGELDWIVMKAMEKDRRRRYETANDFAADVMRHLSDKPVEACPPSAWYRMMKFTRHHRIALTTTALVAGALLAGVAASVAMAIRAAEAERRTASALSQARDGLAEAGRQRAYARRAVDEMYTQVAQKWLSREGAMTPLQREFLEKALAFYEEFAREHANDPEARAEAARAAARVGDIRSQLGLSAQALESYRCGLDAFRLLDAEFPDHPEYRRGVARGLNDTGRLHESLGQTRDAEQVYREALALRQRLAEAPGLPDDRADLAVSLLALGALLDSIGRAGDGEPAELRATEVLAKLIAEFPQEVRYKSLLAGTEMSLGDLYHGLGDKYQKTDRKADAEARYRRSLELCRQMVRSHPTVPDHQEGLARSYQRLGHFYRHTFRYKEAAAEYRNALPVAEKLAVDHPARPQYRSLLTQTLLRLADQLSRLGQFDEAEQTLDRWRENAERLAADYPEVPAHRNQLALGSLQRGSVLAQRGKNREARAAFERAYEFQRKLVADHPELSRYRNGLGWICYSAAVDYATFIELEPRDVKRARELAREAVAIEPEEAGYWKGLALAEYRAGDLDAALKAETKALEIRGGGSYEYDWLLLALIHLGRGDRAQARTWAERVLRGRAPGVWSGGEPDLVRLGRESDERLRALLAPIKAESIRSEAGAKAGQGTGGDRDRAETDEPLDRPAAEKAGLFGIDPSGT